MHPANVHEPEPRGTGYEPQTGDERQTGYEPQDVVTRQAPTAEKNDICLSRRPQHPNKQNEHKQQLQHYTHPRHVEAACYRSRLRA